jgi:glucokinase
MSVTRVLGIDLGGTKIQAGVVDETGQVLGQVRRPTEAQRDAETVLDNIAGAARAAASAAGVDIDELPAVGLGSPGPLDISSGLVISPVNLPSLHGVNIVEELEERLGRPIALNNDANCLGLGEARFGAGKGAEICCGLTLGTGLGGYAILDGNPFNGAHGAGVEIWCSPYLHDHVEQSTNGAAAARCYEKLSGNTADARQVGTLAREGDELAREAWHEYARDLAVPVAWLCNAFDPDVCILGGSVARAWDLFHEELEHEARKYINAVTREFVRLLPAALGDAAGMLGAAALALDRREDGVRPGRGEKR